MKCFFRSFDVGIGDCNVIRMVDGDQQYSIMVDCGQFTIPVKEYVETTLHRHINILVATHIDGDHIVGLVKMLNEMPDLQIDHIWFNVYRRQEDVAPVEMSEQQRAIMEWVKKELPVEFDAINCRREISALQGKSLVKSVLEKQDWNRAWNVEYITKDTPDFLLPADFGKIVFLSPTQSALKAIDDRFKDVFNKYFMEVWNDSLKDGEELPELLLRLADAYKNKYELRPVSISRVVYNAEYIAKQAQVEAVDDSVTNCASIAFMLECGEHRIVMLGDAYAKTVNDTLYDKYNIVGFPLMCDAVKVSHHGSNGNSSGSLLGKLQAPVYFIPGGKGEDYPTWGTFGRIALSHGDKKKVVFSHRCDMSERIDGIEDDVKQALNVETNINENEYELFEW